MIPTILLLSLFGLPFAPIQTAGAEQTSNSGLITAEQSEIMKEWRSTIAVQPNTLPGPFPDPVPFFLSMTLAWPTIEFGPSVDFPVKSSGVSFTLFDFDEPDVVMWIGYPLRDYVAFECDWVCPDLYQEYLNEREILRRDRLRLMVASWKPKLCEFQSFAIPYPNPAARQPGSPMAGVYDELLSDLAKLRENESVPEFFTMKSAPTNGCSKVDNSMRPGPLSQCGALFRPNDLRLEDLTKPVRPGYIDRDGSIIDLVIVPSDGWQSNDGSAFSSR